MRDLRKFLQLKTLSVALFAPLLTLACGTDETEVEEPAVPVQPSDADALTAVLVVPDAELRDGSIPTPSTNQDSPTITRSEESVSYSSGSQVLLPFDYKAQAVELKALMFEVVGASRYFHVDLSRTSDSGTVVLPINVPANVEAGRFCINVELNDTQDRVSSPVRVCITVTDPHSCKLEVSGKEGLTSTMYALGDTAGPVSIRYDTYRIPDRIDVFQGGTWVAGTGSAVERSSIRTALDCRDATRELGYVGQAGIFNFAYDPSKGHQMEIIVAGCENNGTAWEYSTRCPSINPDPSNAAASSDFSTEEARYGSCWDSDEADPSVITSTDILAGGPSACGQSCVATYMGATAFGDYMRCLLECNDEDCQDGCGEVYIEAEMAESHIARDQVYPVAQQHLDDLKGCLDACCTTCEEFCSDTYRIEEELNSCVHSCES